MYEIISKFIGNYRFLSNFWPIEIEYDGMIYPSTENAYQAGKTVDRLFRLPFTKYSNFEAKNHGQMLPLRADWETFKVGHMRKLLQLKFANQYLREELLNTNSCYLMEGNYWHDNFWGICLCTKCYKDKCGQNMLGKLLMEVRKTLEKS